MSREWSFIVKMVLVTLVVAVTAVSFVNRPVASGRAALPNAPPGAPVMVHWYADW